MPTFRGISITLQSQYDALTIPEFPPPSTPFTPSPKRPDGTPGSINSFKTTNAPTNAPTGEALHGIAEVYVPIYSGSQFWINYTCPAPCPAVKFYYFKLFYQDQCLLSWGSGSEDKWSGKVMFGIFDVGTDFEGRQVLEKRAFSFSKAERGGDEAGDLEIRVFRAKERKRQRLRYEKFEAWEGIGGAVSIFNAGRLKKGEPKRMFTYALVDPLDRPFATFKYHFRTAKRIRELDITVLSDEDLRADAPIQPELEFSSTARSVEKPLPPQDCSHNVELMRQTAVPPSLFFPSSQVLTDATSSAKTGVDSNANDAAADSLEILSVGLKESDGTRDCDTDRKLRSVQNKSPITTERSSAKKASARRGIGSTGSFMNVVTKSFKRRSESQDGK